MASNNKREPKLGDVLPVPQPKRDPITEINYRKVKPPTSCARR